MIQKYQIFLYQNYDLCPFLLFIYTNFIGSLETICTTYRPYGKSLSFDNVSNIKYGVSYGFSISIISCYLFLFIFTFHLFSHLMVKAVYILHTLNILSWNTLYNRLFFFIFLMTSIIINMINAYTRKNLFL